MGRHRQKTKNHRSNEYSSNDDSGYYHQSHFEDALPEDVFTLDHQTEDQSYEVYQSTVAGIPSAYGNALPSGEKHNTSMSRGDSMCSWNTNTRYHATGYDSGNQINAASPQSNSMSPPVYRTLQRQPATFYDNNNPLGYSSPENYDSSHTDHSTSPTQTHSPHNHRYKYQGPDHGSMHQPLSADYGNYTQVEHTNKMHQIHPQQQSSMYQMNQTYQHTPGGYSHSSPDNDPTSTMNCSPEAWSKSSYIGSYVVGQVAPTYPKKPISPPLSDVSSQLMGRSTSANVTAVPGHDAILLSDNKMMCQCGAQFMGKQLKNNKSNHKRHLKSLNGDFECEHCGRDFTREDNLQSHIRKKHS